MSNLRKCHNCKGSINLSKEDFSTEKQGNRNIYRHVECGKRLLDFPAGAWKYHGITWWVHLGSECSIKSLLVRGRLIFNADFPEKVETERIPVGEVLNRIDWGDATPEERKEIECKFIETFGEGIAV